MIIYAAENQWISFSGGEVEHMEPYSPLAEASTVVWQPRGEITGVTSLQGNPKHAAILIERKLRQVGEIEGNTRIHIHRVEKLQDTYSVLYSVVQLEEWQRMSTWVSSQRVRCNFYSWLSLVSEGANEGEALIFHELSRMTFFCCIDHRMVHITSIAFSSSLEDLTQAATSLGERVRLALEQFGASLPPDGPNIRWFSAACIPFENALVDAFSNASLLKCEVLDRVYSVKKTDQLLVSAIAALAKNARLRVCLNTQSDKLLYQLDDWIVWSAQLGLVISMPIALLGAFWLFQASAITKQAATVLESVTHDKARIRKPPDTSSQRARLEKQLAFIQKADQLKGSINLPGLLKTLKDSSGNGIRILSVRTEGAGNTDKTPKPNGLHPMLIEGALSSDERVAWDSQLSSLVSALNDAGYSVETTEARTGPNASSMAGRLFSYRLNAKSNVQSTLK